MHYKLNNWILIPLVIILTIFGTLYLTYVFQARKHIVSLNRSKAQVYDVGTTFSVTSEAVADRDFGTWLVESFLNSGEVTSGDMKVNDEGKPGAN